MASGNRIVVDPVEQYELSPFLYMQFMEPLGATDGSVEAAWDHVQQAWRPDVLEVTKELAPGMMRWGGCFSSYYRWKEAVGPRNRRRPMINILWGGVESNQIGSDEFLDFCRQVKTEPLLGVNFESDGRERWAHPRPGLIRTAGPAEAAAWVDFCNNASNPMRRKFRSRCPRRVKWWQIGNETSYDPRGYDCATTARRTVAFAKAMRKADPGIKLIGWGDSGWAREIMNGAGEHLDMLAFHHMFNPGKDDPKSPLRDSNYRLDPDRTWEHLMAASDIHDKKLRWMREQTAGLNVPLAMTECHMTLFGRNRGDVLSTWAAGVFNARMLNVNERHGDVLKIATVADFCGTRWQVNAVMIPIPRSRGRAFLMPSGRVMGLYRAHQGRFALRVAAPDGLDVTASRTGGKIFLHVVNTRRTRAVTTALAVAEGSIAGGRVFEIAAPPEAEIIETCPDLLNVTQKPLPAGRGKARGASSGVKTAVWTFPPASVSAVELDMDKSSVSRGG